MKEAIQLSIPEQAYDLLNEVMGRPNGSELFHTANIMYMLQEDETSLNHNELLAMTQRILDASMSSAAPLLTAERVDAVRTLLENGINPSRFSEFPEATPEQMKDILLNCDIDIFTEIIETVAVDNQEFYAPDNQYSQDALDMHQKAVDAIKAVANREIDIADQKAVEDAVWKLLYEDRASVYDRELDTESPQYKKAMELVEAHCSHAFPELYAAIFGDGTGSEDLLFVDGEKYEYNLFYYNPDSNAGGQIVQCPFDGEQASRMIGNEDYIDVLAENTQYLSDIDDMCFFECVFELLDLKNDGRYLGNHVDEVCQKICEEKEKSLDAQPSLSERITSAQAQAADSRETNSQHLLHAKSTLDPKER